MAFQGGVERCIRVLESCLDEQDWSLACLVCQALWNYCIDSNNITESIVDEDCLCNLEGKCLSLCNFEDKFSSDLLLLSQYHD